MKEIRLHGLGGQGVVKSSQLVVEAFVQENGYGQFIPFFGVERKGSPVFGYLRLDDKPIRLNTQIYEPEIVLIYDDSLLDHPQTFQGILDNSTVILNTDKEVNDLSLPSNVKTIAIVDATKIAQENIGRNIPNTSMLGAFAKVTGLVNEEILFSVIGKAFGSSNEKAARCAYDVVKISDLEGVLTIER